MNDIETALLIALTAGALPFAVLGIGWRVARFFVGRGRRSRAARLQLAHYQPPIDCTPRRHVEHGAKVVVPNLIQMPRRGPDKDGAA